MIKKFLYSITILSCCTSIAVSPYISIRSQSENAARELVGAGWNTQINLPDACDVYGNFSITPEYSQSFKSHRLAECLFGCQCECESCCSNYCNTTCNDECDPCAKKTCKEDCYRIGISGSQRDDRGASDWLADYFGLPTDYKSCVTFKPEIKTFLTDFNMYFGLDKYVKGAYVRVHAPFVHTRWGVNMCEKIEEIGAANHLPGYFDPTLELVGTTTYGIARNNLAYDFAGFMRGCDTIDDPDITMHPLCKARMDKCKHKKTGLSDLQIAVGINPWLEECYHAGFNIRAAFPTGNRPRGNYIFEPIVGNGKHYELGVGFTSHWDFWNSCNDCYNWSIFCDVNVTHLFATKQCRTFDLKCKPLSRYMLAAKYATPVEDLQYGEQGGPIPVDDAQTPTKQFKGEYTTLANITTLPVEVSSAAQADMAIMLQCVKKGGWSCDIGYNLWARTCENIDPLCCCCDGGFEANTWGLKGDAYMYGFAAKPIVYGDDGIALSGTQSQSTICKGTNTGNPAGAPWYQNSGIDNKKYAVNGSTPTARVPLMTFDPASTDPQVQVYTSRKPVLLNLCDIDFDGARTKGLTHKIFGHVDYTWCDKCDCCDSKWTPYMGVGFEVEFAHNNGCCDDSYTNNDESCCTPRCTAETLCGSDMCSSNSCSCNYCAVSQWGIWLKGGAAFN